VSGFFVLGRWLNRQGAKVAKERGEEEDEEEDEEVIGQ